MNSLPEFYEPVSEFEMWRDYREKRSRRAAYFLALLFILFIVASSLPSSDSPVFGTGNTQNPNQPNSNTGSGEPGKDGADGRDGFDGAPGPQGPAGAQGPAGTNGTSSPSIGTVNGQAVIRVGVCDTDIAVSLKSRLVSGVFYFKSITFSGVDSSCFGNSIDVYLLDASQDELASYQGGEVSGSTFYFDYPVFALTGGATNVVASDIESVAIEIAE